jgi:hypothetical protein
MSEHTLYLNLGDNAWLTARCGCGGWHEERQLHQGELVSAAVRELEVQFQRHAGEPDAPPYTPALPVG